MEKTWIKIMLSFVCCMSIVGCNGGVSSTSVDENKSTLKYDTNHIEIPDSGGLSEDYWYYTENYEDFMGRADFLKKQSFIWNMILHWLGGIVQIEEYGITLIISVSDILIINMAMMAVNQYVFMKNLEICSNKIGFLTSGTELDSPESFESKAMFVPTEKHYKDIEIRTESTQKYITEKTYYNLFGIDDGDNELLGSIQIIPNKITIDENDIVEYITTHLTSNKDMN